MLDTLSLFDLLGSDLTWFYYRYLLSNETVRSNFITYIDLYETKLSLGSLCAVAI